jgi:hypothetical protein
MTNLEEIKNKLGETTEQVEAAISPYYTNLEPWKRGTLIIALTLLLLLAIYYFTKPEKNLNTKKEAQMEEKILRQMAFFKRLRE